MREVVFSLKQYKVVRKYDKYNKRPSYIIINVKQSGFAHTHVDSKDTAIQIVKNCVYLRTPLTVNKYLLRSYLRICNNKDYCNYIDSILQSIEFGVEPCYNFIKYPLR